MSSSFVLTISRRIIRKTEAPSAKRRASLIVALGRLRGTVRYATVRKDRRMSRYLRFSRCHLISSVSSDESSSDTIVFNAYLMAVPANAHTV